MKTSWLLLTLIGLVSISTMTVIITFLIRKGLHTSFILFVLFTLVAVAYGSQLALTGGWPKSLSASSIMLLLVIGVLSAVGNLAVYRAIGEAPNPGLVASIVGLQGGLVAILAVFFLRDKLTLWQLFGILLGIVSIIIISLGSRTSAIATSTPTTREHAATKQT